MAIGNGPQADRIEFFEYVQKNIKYYQLQHGVSLNGKATATFMRNQLATYLRKAPKSVNVLLGTFDEKDQLPSLYWMDYLASMVKVNFAAHGYGSNFCISIFDRYWKVKCFFENQVVHNDCIAGHVARGVC